MPERRKNREACKDNAGSMGSVTVGQRPALHKSPEIYENEEVFCG